MASGLQHDAKQNAAVNALPPGFLWGVSTSAFQVEDENSANQWSEWEAAGRIKSGDCRGAACNWWSAAETDFDLASGLGLNALRLSIEWSRIEPREGMWDDAAIERYRTMLLALQQRGIRPFITLHHFTHPLWFERDGGFLHPKTALRFESFTRKVVSELGDLCQDWITINEPNVFATLGYVSGDFPPGKKGDIRSAMRVLSGMARAHAASYTAIHEIQPGARVGWAHNYVVFRPGNRASRADRMAARLASSLFNDSFLHIIEQGRLGFPMNLLGGNVGCARGAYDFVGLNVYSRLHVAFDPCCVSQLFTRIFVPADRPQGDPGVEMPYGEAYPRAMAIAVERVAHLGKPIYILENGVPDAQDRIRPWVIVNAVSQLHALTGRGYDVRGYFHWTLTDNFEWSEGWNLRFGLYALDPKTQERTERKSAQLYRTIVRQNGVSAELLQQFGSYPL